MILDIINFIVYLAGFASVILIIKLVLDFINGK